MSNDSIDVALLRALHERASTELPRRTMIYAQHTPLDAHAKASIPATLLNAIETLAYLSTDGVSVPSAKATEYITSYLNKPYPPNHKQLAQELASWTCAELKLPLDIHIAPLSSFRDQAVLKSITRYTDCARQAYMQRHTIPNHNAMSDILMPIAKRYLDASRHSGIYRLSDEERDVLTKEILDFSCAKPFDRTNKATSDTYAYRTDAGGVSGENIDAAYHYMLGCAGSQNYRNVLGGIFKELADSMSKSVQMGGHKR